MPQKNLPANVSAKVRASVHRAKLFPATVIESYFDRVTVQLVGNGQLMRNLPITGGPVEVGQQVSVDFSVTPPQVNAKGNAYLTADDLEAALKRLGDSSVRSESVISIVLFSGGSAVRMYDPSSEGLGAAIEEAADGDVVWLPDTVISGEFEIGDGVTLSGISSRESMIVGKITLGEGSVLENLKVVGTASFVDTEVLTITAIEEQAVIRNCEIHAYQCTTMDATAIIMEAGALLDLSHSMVVGFAMAGLGYAITFAAGSVVNATHCRFWATTDWFTGTGSIDEYSNTEGFEESLIYCGPPGATYYPNWGELFAQSYGRGYGSVVPGESKNGKIPLVPDSDALRTNVTQAYGAERFTRMGDYIYYTVYVAANEFWIREWKISTQTYNDLQVTGVFEEHGQFVIVEERKVLATSRVNSSWTSNQAISIWLVDFGADTVTLEHDFDTFDPGVTDNPHNIYMLHTPIATKNRLGDVIVAITGKAHILTDYDTFDWDGPAGRYVLTKNWTQNGAWTMHVEAALPLLYSQVWSGDTGLYTGIKDQYMTLVSRHYLFIQGTVKEAYDSPLHFGNPTYRVDGVWIGMWVYDFDTEDFSFTYEHFASADTWGTGLSGEHFGADHENLCAYVTAREGIDFIGRVWKFDVVAKTLAVHVTATSVDFDMRIVHNGSRCYVLVTEDFVNYTILNANDGVAIGPDYVDAGFFILNNIDRVMDDNNNYLWSVDEGANEIIGINLEDASTESFEPDFTMVSGGGSFAKVVCLGDVFIVLNWISGSNYGWRIVRSA